MQSQDFLIVVLLAALVFFFFFFKKINRKKSFKRVKMKRLKQEDSSEAFKPAQEQEGIG